MAAENVQQTESVRLKELLKKLEHEKTAALCLNETLRADIKKLSRELVELKQNLRNSSCDVEPASAKICDNEEPAWVAEGGYERVQQCCLYYHSQSGYYYEAVSQQFLSPVSNYDSENADNTKHDRTETEHTKTQATGMTGDIAAQLAAVSEKATQQCGFVYDESSGLYYDYNTGWYYDQNNQLYYDAENGTYYTYDYDAKQYQIHSHVELPNKEYDPSQDICTIQSAKIMTIDDRIVEEEKPTQLDLMFEDELGEQFLPKRIKDIPDSPPPMSEWPPCVRLIPQNKESTKASELAGNQDARDCVSLITAEGAIIGRDVTGPHSLRIIDIQVSKIHSEIVYLRRKEMYAIRDCGSQNGTYINNCRLSEPKIKSKLYLLQHGDYLKIGSTVFLLHIHRGMACCTDCSHLGITIVGQSADIGESLETQRRKGLNKIKKKYGLRMKDCFGEGHQLPQNYTDKAAERRKNIGSDLPDSAIRDDLPSSVNVPISTTNKGHQMLLRIGWQEGESLGTKNTGIRNPIGVNLQSEKAGLGYSNSMHGIDISGDVSSKNHFKMLRRYQESLTKGNNFK